MAEMEIINLNVTDSEESGKFINNTPNTFSGLLFNFIEILSVPIVMITSSIHLGIILNVLIPIIVITSSHHLVIAILHVLIPIVMTIPS